MDKLLVFLWLASCGARAETQDRAAPERPSQPRDQLPNEPSPLGPHRTIYDFDANRPAAVIYRDGALSIDCGTLDFLKYAHGGFRANWYLRQRWEDRAVAFIAGTGASLRVPLDADLGGAGLENLALVANLKPTVANQRVTVFLNEKPISTADLADDQWQLLQMPLAGAHAGENKLRFQFRTAGNAPPGRSAAAFEQIRIVGPTPATVNARTSYFVWIPAGTKLAVEAGESVHVANDDQPTRELLRKGEFLADLAPYAEQFVRLDFLRSAARARLIAPGEPTKIAPLNARHVFVWMIDTLRPDHVGAYNPKTPVKTPSIDQFAKRGVLFRNATDQGNWSLTSHASILTGLYPAAHGGYDEKDKLSESLDFAGEIFQREKFTTATFLSNGYVSGKWGFQQGWDYYTNFVRDSKPSDAKWLWTHAREWLKTRNPTQERLFVYLGTIDPHVIYNPPKDYLAMYHPEPYEGRVKPTMTGILLGQIKNGTVTLGEADKRYVHALYQGEISYNDYWFGQMQEDLKALGMLDDSAIVVVSDHGDEFYEHGSVGHGHSVYQELVATPLLLAGGGLPAGREVEVDVEAADILPTLLDLTGLDPSKHVQTESLLPLVFQDGAQAARPAFSTQGGTLFGMKLGPMKMVTRSPDRTELYDLSTDPREQTNIIDARPIASRAALNAFALYIPFAERWHKTQWGVSSNLRSEYAQELGP